MKLADGKDYELGEITLGDHRRYRDAIKKEQQKPNEERTLDPGLTVILASLKKCNPDIQTIDQVSELVTFKNYEPVLRAVMVASGIITEEKPAGEPAPVPATASA